LLSEIADDLKIKTDYCKAKGLTSRVPVKVLTKRNGVDEVKGLRVLYVEKFFQSDPNARPQEFRRFSSPAVDDLVPGRYVFWAKEATASGRNGQQKEARVGLGLAKPIEVLTP
jgi:hypothetical protein